MVEYAFFSFLWDYNAYFPIRTPELGDKQKIGSHKTIYRIDVTSQWEEIENK